MRVVWTHEAENSFNGIIDFLLTHWTYKEADEFISLVSDVIAKIRSNPQMFKISEYDGQSRMALITKHTTMFYRIQNRVIEVEYFRGNYQDPTKLKEILRK